jgi:predicted AAA+ superfamily ATPase
MSLNFDKIGRNLCKINGGKYDNKIISVYSDGFDNDTITKQFSSLKLPNNGKFQQIPDEETTRAVVYITGASGSGKSTYCASYIKEYKKLFKKNNIYCFSALKDDESLDVIKPKRIKIDNSLIDDPLDVADFENSLVVFDDIDVISDKKQREAVYNILNQILEVGRHHKISCIITNHLATNGKDTKRILNECHSVVYFPFSGSGVGLKRLLVDYLGLDKKDISKAKKCKSRWVCVFKNYPQIIMTEKDIWMPAMDDD